MATNGLWRRVLGLCVLLVFAGANMVAAQTERSSLVGTVTDQSGATLPGVNVTITSPALQLPQMVTVTGTEGEYRFTLLPGGVYDITFELPGFQTVKREGVRVNVGFVARIDTTMNVGAVAESVTVTGASPVVDASTTAISTNFGREALEAIPTSRNLWQIIQMSPGVRITSTTPDVGGNTVGTQQLWKTYGVSSGGQHPLVEGVLTREWDGAYTGNFDDFGSLEEVQISATGNDPEVGVPGTLVNRVLKSGGNQFHGSYLGQWQSPKFQSNNVDDALRAQVGTGNPFRHYHDVSGDLGGRVIPDRLWFYGAARQQRTRSGVIGFTLASPEVWWQSPANPAGDGEYRIDLLTYTGKVTSQLSRSNRLQTFVNYTTKRYPMRGGDAFTPAEATEDQLFKPIFGGVEWTAVPSDRSVFNFLVGRYWYLDDYHGRSSDFSRYDAVTLRYAGEDTSNPHQYHMNRWQFTGSYTRFVPEFLGGSHDIKVGGEALFEASGHHYLSRTSADFVLIHQLGVPFQIQTLNTPVTPNNLARNQVGYIKDRWSIGDRLTLNLGLRVERYHGFIPAQSKAAGTFSPAVDYPLIDVWDWGSLQPRIAMSYALTADAKTVVKGSYGRFGYILTPITIQNFNPSGLITTTYQWLDNGNGLFDAGELGNFISSTGASSRAINPDTEQPKVDEITGTFEREVMADFSARASYIYKRESNLYQDVNVLRPFSAYTIPVTRTDPGPDNLTGTADDGGAVTYYDYDPAFRGPQFERILNINTPGYTNRYHNLEIVANKRLSNRWQMLVSYLATHRDVWISGIPQDPNAEFFPKDQTWESMFRMSGSYLLPFDVQVAANFSHQSGVAYARTVRFASGLPQLGSVTLRMEPTGAQRRPSINLLSLRAEKRQRLPRGGTVSFQVDLFNALNNNVATNITAQSGPSYGRITAIVPPRIARFGVTYSF